MSNRLRVGVIGTGHGLRTIAPALQSTGEFEICAVSGSSIPRVEELLAEGFPEAKAMDFKDIIEMQDLDLICVASPNEFHAEHMTAVANSKCHLYLEKPIGNSVEEARQISEAILHGEQSRKVVVGHQLRFNPFLRKIRSKIEDGALGKLYSIVVTQRGGAFASSNRPWTWEFERSRGGGVRLAMGTHILDLANFVGGRKLVSSYVNMDAVHKNRYPMGTERRVDVCNFFSASLDYGDFEAYITTSAASHGPGTFEVEVLGSEGSVYFDGLGRLLHYIDGVEQPQWISDHEISVYQGRPGSSIFRKSLSVMAEEMAKAIRGEKNDLGLAASVTESVELLETLDEAMNAYNSRVAPPRDMF